jgi:hypothetical protein
MFSSFHKIKKKREKWSISKGGERDRRKSYII